ncbi:MAG TPA: hypothetical protein VGP70_13810 [Actinomadura sp.]|nr:hypothetical protein [Actinomadura sp.]
MAVLIPKGRLRGNIEWYSMWFDFARIEDRLMVMDHDVPGPLEAV